MSAIRTETTAYVAPGLGSRVRDWAGAIWADKARLRRIGMIWGLALIGSLALFFWLTGGRYISSDDAYVHAAKLMVSTDVSGLVQDVDVHEGQSVRAGDILFRLDPHPFQIALDNAQASLAQAALDVEGTKAQYRSILGQIGAQQAQVNLASITFGRYQALVRQNAIAPSQLDIARGTLQSAQATLVSLQQQAKQNSRAVERKSRPSGDPGARLLAGARRSRRGATPAQSLGRQGAVRRYRHGSGTHCNPARWSFRRCRPSAPTSAVGLVASKNIWVDANLKETELTYVRQGNPVEITVDTYPSCTWNGSVDAISAGSNSTFSALPSENASGNWVKVVQRIPVRIRIGGSSCNVPLRAGMSTVISVDTGHRRWYRMLFGN